MRLLNVPAGHSNSNGLPVPSGQNAPEIKQNKHIVETSKEPVCPWVELILKIIIILLIIFLGFIKSKPC